LVNQFYNDQVSVFRNFVFKKNKKMKSLITIGFVLSGALLPDRFGLIAIIRYVIFFIDTTIQFQ